MAEQFPIIINVRDRLSPLLLLLEWLESVGQREIWLCDNASTYPPMIEFLNTTPHRVVFTKFNLGKRAPWLSGLVPEVGNGRYFVVTDPDVVPTEDCPTDALQFFKRSLQEHPEINKIGFSLKLDDLPDTFVHKQNVIEWERQFWTIPAFNEFYRVPTGTGTRSAPSSLGSPLRGTTLAVVPELCPTNGGGYVLRRTRRLADHQLERRPNSSQCSRKTSYSEKHPIIW
jgi:hypothetical protein